MISYYDVSGGVAGPVCFWGSWAVVFVMSHIYYDVLGGVAGPLYPFITHRSTVEMSVHGSSPKHFILIGR
jgi:hypothetical protein